MENVPENPVIEDLKKIKSDIFDIEFSNEKRDELTKILCKHNDMLLDDIKEMRHDIHNLKETNELMLIKLIEFLSETGKLTPEDFPILTNKIKQIGEQLDLIG